MHTFLIILLTIIIIFSLLTVYYITLYNKIQFSKIRIDEAEKVIIDELQIRYDLVESCKKTISKNTKMDLDVFIKLEKAIGNKTPYELDKIITETIATIYIVKNDYPKIEERKGFKEIIRKIEESNTKLDAAKSFYNKNNAKLIALIKSFPSNIVSLIHGVKIKPFYEAKEIFNEIDDGIKV